MSTIQRVVIYQNINKKESRPKRPWLVRWSVDGRERSRSFAQLSEARKFRTRMEQAVANGLPFSATSGLPGELGGPETITVLDFAKERLRRERNHLSARSLAGIAEGLAITLPAMSVNKEIVTGLRDPGFRSQVERLLKMVLNPFNTSEVPTNQTGLKWRLEILSPHLTQVTPRDIEHALEHARTNQNGQPAAPATYARRRAALSKLFTAAVQENLIPSNPFNTITGERSTSIDAHAIDPIMVAEPAHVEELLSYVTNPTYRLHLQFMFYTGLRPGEVAALRVRHIHLPAVGRGELLLQGSETEVDPAYHPEGLRREVRPLKHREKGAARRVPIPRKFAVILGEHLEGRGLDERVVASRTGTPLQASNVARVYNRAREAWADAQPVRPSDLVMPTPYSLRHAAATLWLQYAPEQQVAYWLGNSVNVLMRVYANVIPTRTEVFSQMVDEALG